MAATSALQRGAIANSSVHVLNEWFSEDVLPDVAKALGVTVDSLDAIPFR